MITNYRAGKGFTRRMKVTGVVAVTLSFGLTIGLAVRNGYVAVALALLGLSICAYIVTRPTKHPDPVAA